MTLNLTSPLHDDVDDEDDGRCYQDTEITKENSTITESPYKYSPIANCATTDNVNVGEHMNADSGQGGGTAVQLPLAVGAKLAKRPLYIALGIGNLLLGVAFVLVCLAIALGIWGTTVASSSSSSLSNTSTTLKPSEFENVSNTVSPTNNPLDAPSDTWISSPSRTESIPPTTIAPTQPFQSFATTTELREAIQAYYFDNGADIDVAHLYGHPYHRLQRDL